MIISLFRIIYDKKSPIIDQATLAKAMGESLPEILEKVSEDKDSELKLIKELGKIAYCLHSYYKDTFEKFASHLATFFKTALTSDCSEIKVLAAFNMPAMASIYYDREELDCSALTLEIA